MLTHTDYLKRVAKHEGEIDYAVERLQQSAVYRFRNCLERLEQAAEYQWVQRGLCLRAEALAMLAKNHEDFTADWFRA